VAGSDGNDGLARVTATLTAAAGLGALVAFTGAAIAWVRFQEAKLPGDQAVAVTPEQSLITTGGVALGAFVIVGATAVAIAYLLDRHGTRRGQAVGVIVLTGIGIAAATLFADASWGARRTAILVVAGADLAALCVATIAFDLRAATWLRAHRQAIVRIGYAAVAAAAVVIWLVLGDWLAATVLFGSATILTGLLELAFASLGDEAGRRRSVQTWLLANASALVRFLALPVGLAVLAGVLYGILGVWWIVVVVAVGAALGGLVLLVAHRTRRKFRWYGAAVFVAVVVFGAVMHGVRTLESPRLQPMAVLFTEDAGGGGQSGLFVAQTDDHVYLGLVQRCHRDPKDLVLRPGSPKGGTGEIVTIPRESIEAEAVGTMASVNTALARGPALLDDLGKRLEPARERRALPQPCEEEGVIDQKVRASNEMSEKDAAPLAKRFRPWLRFDSEESWRPLEINAMLTERLSGDGPAHRFCDGSEQAAKHEDMDLHCSPITTPAQISAQPNDPKTFVDIRGTELGGGDYVSPVLQDCPPPQAKGLKDCERGGASRIYFHAVRANGRIYIDYWWFLRYNRFDKKDASELCRSALTRQKACFDHEGDWEGVTVVLSGGDDPALDFVDYAAHEAVFRYTASQVERKGQRPVVYLANGSHAAYPRACPKDCSQEAKLFGHALPEDNTDGKRDWGRNPDDECFAEPTCLAPLPSTSWGVFAGFWGSRTCHAGKGACDFGVPPRSPSQQRRFKSPWCYSGVGLKLTCDGAPPSRTTR
jgi:hypothetical protein